MAEEAHPPGETSFFVLCKMQSNSVIVESQADRTHRTQMIVGWDRSFRHNEFQTPRIQGTMLCSKTSGQKGAFLFTKLLSLQQLRAAD